MRLALVLILTVGPVFAQETSLSIGAAHYKLGSNEVRAYGPAGLAVSVQVAVWPSAPVSPTFSFHHARFADARPSVLEGGGFESYAGTLGLRVQPFRDGSVRPYARAALGIGREVSRAIQRAEPPRGPSFQNRQDVLSADLALGVTVGQELGLFGVLEVASVSGVELFGTTTHNGLRVGVGWRR